jgi:hypothetical protein
MTGAVSAVNMKESLGDRPISNITAALQGVVPGLKIEATTGTPYKKPSSADNEVASCKPFTVIEGMTTAFTSL